MYTVHFNIRIKLIKDFSIYDVSSSVSYNHAKRCTNAGSGHAVQISLFEVSVGQRFL
jgi:hypothetical protein